MTQTATAVETLRLAGDTLELLDQRRLPGAVAWVRCTRAADTAAAIRAMVVRGAPAIGVTAAYGIALEAQALAAGAAALEPVKAADAVGAGARLPHEVSTCGSGVPAATGADGADGAAAAFADALEAGFAALAASRPTAVNLFWALDRMRRAWRDAGAAAPAALAEQLLAAAKAIHADDVAANRALGAHGAALLQDGARVLTHCNAGALATAGHGTALGVVRSAVAAGKRISVIADETRPFLQGARLTAWELQAEGIPVTLITDNMSGHLMAQGEIDAVVVGTDRVAANGDVANKIGTYMVAVLARHHGIPFYVACPLSTIDPAVADGSAIPIEERAPEEVTGYGSEQWAPAGVAARHPAFDITPAALVTALVTEAGVVMQPDAAKIAALLARPL